MQYHIDSLELNLELEEGSQYFVAPFIKKYFKNHENIIGIGLVAYLQNLTGMELI